MYSLVIVAFDGTRKTLIQMFSQNCFWVKSRFFFLFHFRLLFPLSIIDLCRISFLSAVFGFFYMCICVFFSVFSFRMTVAIFCSTCYFTIILHVGFCSDINRIEISEKSSNLFQTGFYTEYFQNDSNIFF